MLLFFYGLFWLIKHDFVVPLKSLELSGAQLTAAIAVADLIIVAENVIDPGYVTESPTLVSLAGIPAREGVFRAVNRAELMRGAVALVASGYLLVL